LGDRETGAKAALPIWIQFMKIKPATGSPPYFDLPDNVIKVRMDPQTGMLATAGSKNAVDALFIKGTEPKE
jgi:penicillin-binding protein 1A